MSDTTTTTPSSVADVEEAMRDVVDPELGINVVDLGLVGVPSARSDTRLLLSLTAEGFVPVIACIGIGADGRLFNVNADTLAAHLAARLTASRLVIAGTTAGVLGQARMGYFRFEIGLYLRILFGIQLVDYLLFVDGGSGPRQ